MRVFIAIDFKELRDYLNAILGAIDTSSAKLNEVSTFHLTLKFLGEVSDDNIALIKEKLKQIKFEPFTLTLSKLGIFPNENYIKVIWVGLNPPSPVIDLQKKIEDSLKEFNTKKDYDFHPHITLARVKFVKDKENFVKNLKEIRIEPKQINVKDFRLIKSTLSPDGPIYEDLEIFFSMY